MDDEEPKRGRGRPKGSQNKEREGLSTDPGQIRRRIRRKGNKLHKEIELLAEVQGKPLDEWDDEELARGRTRDKNGGWSGRPPMWITPKIRQEALKRFEQGTLEKMRGKYNTAIEVIETIMTSTEVDYETGKPVVSPQTRLDAAKFVVNQVVGTPKARVEVDAGDNLSSILASALVNPDGKPSLPGGVIDGEVVDDDEEGDGE